MRYLFLVLTIFLFVRTDNLLAQSPKPPSAKNLAKKICTCTQPVALFMTKVKEIEEGKVNMDNPAFVKLMKNLKEETQKLETCIAEIKVITQSIKTLSERKISKYEKTLEKLLKKSCLSVYEILEGTTDLPVDLFNQEK